MVTSAITLNNVLPARAGIRYSAASECQSAFKFDPPYCLICRCYPDGANADDDPMSIDRPRQVTFPTRSTRGLWAGRALHSPSRPQPRVMGQRFGVAERLLSDELFGSLPSKRHQQMLHD